MQRRQRQPDLIRAAAWSVTDGKFSVSVASNPITSVVSPPWTFYAKRRQPFDEKWQAALGRALVSTILNRHHPTSTITEYEVLANKGRISIVGLLGPLAEERGKVVPLSGTRALRFAMRAASTLHQNVRVRWQAIKCCLTYHVHPCSTMHPCCV